MVEKEVKLNDYLRKISPGSHLRTVIDDLINAGMGALIVFDNSEIRNMIEGGFKVNCKFTPNKLFELCKMDGAVIVSPDLKKILYANVLLTPDPKIPTSETGTRHKSGERTALQSGSFVIVVSERKNKTTLYLGGIKYFLKDTQRLLGEVTSNVQLLEKQRELFNEAKEKLDILEMSDLVSISDVANLIQRAEMIIRISNTIKRYFTELGNVGSILSLRYKELIRSVEKTQENVIKDYSQMQFKKSKALIETFSFDSLMDREVIAKLILGGPIEESVQSRGYRFLYNLNLDEKVVSLIVRHFKFLPKIFEGTEEQFKEILKEDAKSIRDEIHYLRDQILSGKSVS